MVRYYLDTVAHYSKMLKDTLSKSSWRGVKKSSIDGEKKTIQNTIMRNIMRLYHFKPSTRHYLSNDLDYEMPTY